MLHRHLVICCALTLLVIFFYTKETQAQMERQELPTMEASGVAMTWPRVTIGGRGIVTPQYTAENGFGGNNDEFQINYADTELFTEFDLKLYSKVHAGFLTAFKFTEKDVDYDEFNPVFFSQVNAFMDAEHWGLKIGRSRLNNRIVTFPTIRDDDMLDYTYVKNAFVDDDVSEFSQYGDVLRGDLYFRDTSIRISGTAARQFGTEIMNQDVEIKKDYNLNTYSGELAYILPEGLRYNQYLRMLAATYYAQEVTAEDQSFMHSVVGGFVTNLTRNPIQHFDLRGQVIYNAGVDVDALDGVRERARAEYVSGVAAVRYLWREDQIPRVQLALNGGYKDYLGFDASQWALVPSVVYRLGNGFDALAEYKYERYTGDLRNALDMDEAHTVWVGLAYSFEAIFNDYIGERTELVNVLHGYIP